MSSVGQALGGGIGAIAGFFIGGPQGAYYGAQIGMTIGGIIDPPKGPKIQGPRLSDLSVQTATYGAFIPRVYGTIALNGNVFWLENNKLKEVEKKEKQGGKGGPPKSEVTTWSYYATFAVGLCEGPIDAVRRIWVGSKLVYDAGSADIATIIAGNETSSLFNLHKGTETQLADTRMQSTLGVSNTPAYRGLAYIVFSDYPLADHGNSLAAAQVKVEVIKTKIPTSPVFLGPINIPGVPRLYTSSALHTDASGRMFVFISRSALYVTDQNDVYGVFATGPTNIVSNMLPFANTAHVNGWADIPCVVTIFGLIIFTLYVQNENGGVIHSIGVSNSGPGATLYYRRGVKQFFVDLSAPAATTNIYDISGASAVLVSSTNSASLYGRIHDIFIGVTEYYAITLTKQFICFDENWAVKWVVDLSAELNILVTLGSDSTLLRSSVDGQIYLKSKNYFWLVTKDGYTSFGAAAGLPTAFEEFGGHTIIGKLWMIYAADTNQMYLVSLDRVLSDSALLSSIVSEECLSSKLLTAPDIDVTALTSTVRGYRISSLGAIRGGIEPLQGAWPFDAVQAGYKIKFIPRGQASVATIPIEKLDARAAGDQPGVQITNVREMDSVLPRKVSIKYFDSAREYDQGEQYAERLNTDAVNIKELEMAIVFITAEAAQKADVLLYMYWLERYDVSFSLPPEYVYLEPADVITITSTAATYNLRLTQISYTSDGRLECVAKYNNAATYTSTATGEEGQSTGALLKLAGPTLYELMDIPLVQDVYNLSGYPVAMTGYLSGWPGGLLYRSDDGGQTWSDVQGFNSPGSTIGYATNALAAHPGTLIDKTGRMTAILYQGSLSSITELQMLNGTNHFAYGVDGRWEIIAAQNCVLQGDGSYVLTDFLRGRFGTEIYTGTHAVNDKLIYLSSTQLAFVLANTNSIGSERKYRGITSGKAIDSDTNRSFTYRGVNLECLNPVYINGNRHPTTNDWTLTWIRRTRIGGEWRDLVDATMGETVESYEVEIYDGAAYTTVKRTLTAATQTTPYTSAQQVTDFGSNQATLYAKIYQLSSVVGRGYPLTTSISR